MPIPMDEIETVPTYLRFPAASAIACCCLACADIPHEGSAQATLELDRLVTLPNTGGEGAPPWATVSDVTITADGEVVVLDGMGPGVYRYTQAGAFAGTLGAEGQGPGEYRSPTNVVALDDGRVALWDPGNARMLFFDVDGPAGSFPVASGLMTVDRSLYAISDSLLLVRTHVAGERSGQSVLGFLAYDTEGNLRDTIAPPWPPRAQRTVGVPGSLEGPIPLTPTDAWIVTPEGEVLASHRDHYQLVRMTMAGDTIAVITRDAERVAVQDGERDAYQAAVEFAFGRRDPGWSWPRSTSFPETKPAIAELRPVIDGGFAVVLHGTGVEFPERRAEGRVHWGEARRVDVYTAGGDLVGRFDLPSGERLMQLSRHHVITTTRDELGRTQLHVYALTPHDQPT